jgi:hypothetical protein
MGLLQALHLPPLGPKVPPGKGSVSIAINKPGKFEPGSQQQLAATALLDGTTRDVTRKVRWESSNEEVVRMLPGGVALSVRAGQVRITATLIGGTARDAMEVTVKARLKDIVITPENPLVASGRTEELTATAILADGNTENVTFLLKWSTDKPRVASVEPGECTAGEPGTARIEAWDPDNPDIIGVTRVAVFAPGRGPALESISLEPLNPDIRSGTPVQFRAWGHFPGNAKHEITNHVRWTSSDKDVLTIHSSLGRAVPRLRSGNPVVTALDPATNKSQSTTVYVAMPGVKDISVEPKVLSLAVDEFVPVVVTATFHGGGEMRVNDLVQWKPVVPGVMAVPPLGSVVRAVAPGETDIDVVEPLSGALAVVHVTVVPAP